MILVDEDKKKLQANYEEQKKINIGGNFDPEKSIEDFINGIEEKLSGRNKPPKRPDNPFDNKDPNNPPDPKKPTPNPLNPFQTDPNSNPNQNFFQNKQLIIIAGIALLVILYFYSQSKSKEENYYYDF